MALALWTAEDCGGIVVAVAEEEVVGVGAADEAALLVPALLLGVALVVVLLLLPSRGGKRGAAAAACWAWTSRATARFAGLAALSLGLPFWLVLERLGRDCRGEDFLLSCICSTSCSATILETPVGLI